MNAQSKPCIDEGKNKVTKGQRTLRCLIATFGWLLVGLTSSNLILSESTVASTVRGPLYVTASCFLETTLAFSTLVTPRQWKTTLVALLYVVSLLAVQQIVQYQSLPAYATFINIDLPEATYTMLSQWIMLKIASLLLGIEFFNDKPPPASVWTLSRLFAIMVCVAVLTQVLIQHARWYANLIGDPSIFNNITGPVPSENFEATHEKLIALKSISIFGQFVVPVLLACWLASGSKKRWLLLPICLLVAVLLEHVAQAQCNNIALSDTEILKYWEWLNPRSTYANLLGSLTLTALSFMLTFALLAILTPAMGYSWRKSISPTPKWLKKFLEKNPKTSSPVTKGVTSQHDH
jgi:hypothetical protein